MVYSVDNSSLWAHVNLSLPPLFPPISSLFFILLLLHFISRRFVLMDFAVILPLMAFAFNGGACMCVLYCVFCSCMLLCVCMYICVCCTTPVRKRVRCIHTCVSVSVSLSFSRLAPCLLLLQWSRLPPPYIIHKCWVLVNASSEALDRRLLSGRLV